MNTLINSFPLSMSAINNEKLNVFQSTSIRLFLNLKGETKISINNVPYNLAANDLIILNAYDICTIFKSNSILIALEIDTTLLNLSETDKKAYFVCNSTLTKNKEKFSFLKSIIVRLINNYTEISQPKAFSAAYEIYDELLKNFTQLQQSARKVNSKINEIIKYIESNYTENLLLNDIAEKFNFSAPYLSKLFKDSTGKSFADFYDELRINHSLYDLLETNETIIDIAYKHGFPNNHAYIRAYKKIKGVLPNAARKAHSASGEEGFSAIINQNNLIESIKKILSGNDFEILENSITASFFDKSIYYLPDKPSHEVLGIGKATSVLNETTKNIISALQQHQPFRYAYIRGIFDDTLSFCTKTNNGSLSFKFALIDEILDFLDSSNLIPMLSFAYMPHDIAKKSNYIPFEGYFAIAPQKIEKWTQTVTTFLNHVIARYGEAKVEKWIIIPWILPLPSEKYPTFSSDEDFFQFYKTTYTAIKTFSPSIKVSSPEIYLDGNYIWLNTMLQWCNKNDCLPDHFSIIFPNLTWQLSSPNTASQISFVDIIEEDITFSENLMNENLVALKSFLQTKNFNRDIYVTAFDCSLTKKHTLFETLYSANYFLKNSVDNFNLIKSLAFWRLIDYEARHDSKDLFSGGTGWYLTNGISKGVESTSQFLKHTKPYVIDNGPYYLLSKHKEKSNYYHLLLFNYEQPAIQPERDFDSYNNNPYSLFKNIKKKLIHLKIVDLPFKYALIRIYTINKDNGAPYEKWIAMGMPDLNKYSEKGKAIFRIFDAKTYPDYNQKIVPIKDGIFRYDFPLELFEINGVEILFSDSADPDSFIPN